MRIALVALSAKGAMAQYVGSLASGLYSSRERDIDLFVPEHFPVKYLTDGADGGVRLHLFKTGTSRVSAGVRLASPISGTSLAIRILHSSPDVVHLVSGEGYPWARIMAQWLEKARIPLVVTVHDPEPHLGEMLSHVNALLRRGVLARATLVHVHSRRFIPIMIRQGVSENVLRVIPHGSFAHLFTRHLRTGTVRERAILFFGRLAPYKGLDLLLEALPEVRPPAKLIIAGPGRISKRAKRMLSQLNHMCEVHNRFLDEAEVAELFQRASVCVMPYRQATQSSLPLIAAGFGVPVVATAVGALVEDVEVTGGIVVDPHDRHALAAGIRAAFTIRPTHPRGRSFVVLAEEFRRVYREAVQAKNRCEGWI